VPADENPGAILGAILGTLQKNGRDKVTIFASPGISDLGAWLEQLIAESTGKKGTGLIPIDREQIGPPEVYGNDRIFAYVRLQSAPDAKQDEAVLNRKVTARGAHRRPGCHDQPGILPVGIATAVEIDHRHILFNSPTGAQKCNQEPDVQHEKQSFPAEHPFFEGGSELYSDEKHGF
jgi:hypothetical protein